MVSASDVDVIAKLLGVLRDAGVTRCTIDGSTFEFGHVPSVAPLAEVKLDPIAQAQKDRTIAESLFYGASCSPVVLG